VKKNKPAYSRFSDHLQWVRPTRSKKKKNYFAFKPAKGWRDAPSDCLPLHNPPLSPRDEAIFFLHMASEVEHSLMIQYLYAGFSLGGAQVPEDKKEFVNDWRVKIMGIAREEMGHLITVQNILHSIGGPLTFQREDFPFDSKLYPFHFSLERLTKNSLAKYVVAEMPSDETLKNNLPLIKELKAIKAIAQMGNKGKPINRVGVIYETIQKLLDGVKDEDFLKDSDKFQSPHSAWGTNDPNIIIEVATSRAEAKAALAKVAEQGEGDKDDLETPAETSHFDRFLNIYRAFPSARGWQASKLVPLNPSTNLPASDPDPSIITDEQALLWAQLSNQRYRMILLYLSHTLQMEIKPASFYGQLVSWTFGEMYNLRSISDILTTLPQQKGNRKGPKAASPFELPYNLNLPAREVNKWRAHRDQLLNSRIIIDELLEYNDLAHAKYLHALRNADDQALATIHTILTK